MLNHITVMGRLTRDPELRHTQDNVSVCGFTVAVERDYQPHNAEQKQTDFIDVVVWRQTAEFVSKYFSKGRMIIVDGSLHSRKWQDKTGQNRTSWEVVANNIYFGDSRRDYAPGSVDAAPYGSFADAVPASDFSQPLPPESGSYDDLTQEENDGDLPF